MACKSQQIFPLAPKSILAPDNANYHCRNVLRDRTYSYITLILILDSRETIFSIFYVCLTERSERGGGRGGGIGAIKNMI